jgi:hypothetical protein
MPLWLRLAVNWAWAPSFAAGFRVAFFLLCTAPGGSTDSSFWHQGDGARRGRYGPQSGRLAIATVPRYTTMTVDVSPPARKRTGISQGGRVWASSKLPGSPRLACSSQSQRPQQGPFVPGTHLPEAVTTPGISRLGLHGAKAWENSCGNGWPRAVSLLGGKLPGRQSEGWVWVAGMVEGTREAL